MAVAEEGAAFDIEAEVQKFLADASQTELQLPNLTSGQRQHARKLAEMSPELRCQSYGLGSERQLHIFKEDPQAEKSDSAGEASEDAAFDFEAAIIAFIADTDTTTLELPHLSNSQRKQARRLAEQHAGVRCETYGLSADRRLLLRKGAAEENPDRPGWSFDLRLPSDAKLGTGDVGGECGSEVSTCTSGRTGDVTPCTPSLPEGLQVRNTFISCIENESIDERAVQSMPHGMFRQNLWEELQEKKAALKRASSAAVTPALADTTTQEDTAETTTTSGSAALQAEPVVSKSAAVVPQVECLYKTGTVVVINGLTKLPAFNGMQGSVQNFDAQTGRYDILFFSPVGPTGQQWAKVRAENLQFVSLPQPPNFAAPSMDYGGWMQPMTSLSPMADQCYVDFSMASPVACPVGDFGSSCWSSWQAR